MKGERKRSLDREACEGILDLESIDRAAEETQAARMEAFEAGRNCFRQVRGRGASKGLDYIYVYIYICMKSCIYMMMYLHYIDHETYICIYIYIYTHVYVYVLQ